MNIAVIGAGGRAGRAATEEAERRGHDVSAVVRDTGKHAGLSRPNVTVVQGDATDPGAVAQACAGHDAVIAAIADLSQQSEAFYGAASKALVDGLREAGVSRLVWVGLATLLEVQPGTRMIDTDQLPEDGKAFSRGHAVALDTFASSDESLDWVALAPPLSLVEGERTGSYTHGDLALLDGQISYADLAIALVDEAERPTHHRRMVAVGG